MILDGIRDYIANSREMAGVTSHVTMTCFWIQIVHFAMRGMEPTPGRSIKVKELKGTSETPGRETWDLLEAPDDVTLRESLDDPKDDLASVDDDWTVIISQADEQQEQQQKDADTGPNEEAIEMGAFRLFLLSNPHVVDEELWADYYSTEVMMSLTAEAELVFPDKKSLPNIVNRDFVRAR